MESVCLIFHFTDTGETEKIFLRGNNNYLQTSWSAGKLQKYLYSFFYVYCNTSSKSGCLLNFHSLAEIISIYDSQKEERKQT